MKWILLETNRFAALITQGIISIARYEVHRGYFSWDDVLRVEVIMKIQYCYFITLCGIRPPCCSYCERGSVNCVAIKSPFKMSSWDNETYFSWAAVNVFTENPVFALSHVAVYIALEYKAHIPTRISARLFVSAATSLRLGFEGPVPALQTQWVIFTTSATNRGQRVTPRGSAVGRRPGAQGERCRLGAGPHVMERAYPVVRRRRRLAAGEGWCIGARKVKEGVRCRENWRRCRID